MGGGDGVGVRPPPPLLERLVRSLACGGRGGGG